MRIGLKGLEYLTNQTVESTSFLFDSEGQPFAVKLSLKDKFGDLTHIQIGVDKGAIDQLNGYNPFYVEERI